MKENIDDFIKELYDNCSKETCYPKVASKWTETNKFWGHCAIVAVLIQERFGGKIVKCDLKEENISHYFNLIDGEEIDATIVQYDKVPTKTNFALVDKNEILQNQNTFQRFQTLSKKIKRK